MTKILAGLVLALSLALAGSVALWRHESSVAKQATAERDQLKASLAATNAAMDAKDKALKAAKNQYTKEKQKLEDALAANPDWAGTAVPDSVWNGLHIGTDPTAP